MGFIARLLEFILFKIVGWVIFVGVVLLAYYYIARTFFI